MQGIIIMLLCLFVMYRMFRRVRRNIGWQQLEPGKMRLFTVIFSVIGMLLLIEGAFYATSLISDAIGILLGLMLAYYGAALTRFEQRGGRWHYRPNTWIGVAVTVLFFGRLIYRFYDMYSMPQGGGVQGGLTLAGKLQTMVSGWTAGLLLVMFAYYVGYNLLILRKQKQLSR
ncbi:hypothetical protein ACFQI7_31230 [Paenibacillus allorhizosphaerae]|uniref:Protein csk22 n=1 Tax=Paenibacillus allorhizosphaerae TaxID=2849866 RepID=A0ABN7TVH4_9BACL|nr:hypothetical protein [Paenibacillus allorhizosphaerae]CAG7653765.1 Protein csk22 [Paenibacillus allorhizosphaerae]